VTDHCAEHGRHYQVHRHTAIGWRRVQAIDGSSLRTKHASQHFVERQRGGELPDIITPHDSATRIINPILHIHAQTCFRDFDLVHSDVESCAQVRVLAKEIWVERKVVLKISHAHRQSTVDAVS
jgi:hypothetical protein